MKKVLFITQNMKRTGSEMVLWYLLRNIDQNKIKPYLYCLKKGELFETLPENIQKSIGYKDSGKWYLKVLRAWLKLIGRDPLAYQLQQIHQKFQPDYWYINTLAIPQVHPIGYQLGAKIVTHFHEYLYAYTFISAIDLKNIIEYSAVTIGCSEPVCSKLIELGHQDVKLQYSFINEKYINPKPERIATLRRELGIAETDFVWIISGTVTYLKGLDYLPQIMAHFKTASIKVIWLGASQQTGLDYYVQLQAAKEYGNKLIFTGAVTADYFDYFSLGNAYLSLSREECLSLSMLEAAYLKKPIVSFATGITKQFIKEGMGIVVDSWSPVDIIKAMSYLHAHPEQNGDLLRQSALAFTVDQQVPRFENLLNQI